MNQLCIGIIGAGTMGTQIGALAASCGHSVNIHDITRPPNLEKQITRTQKLLNRSTETQAYLSTKSGDCTFVENIQDLADSSILIECVAENMEIKSDVLAQISKIAKPDSIIGTNTSSLPLDKLANCVTTPERFLGVHFFNPIHAVPLVEVCGLPSTATESVIKMKSFLETLGRTIVPVPNSPGFVVNRLLFLMIASAARMLDDHAISPKDLDTAMKAGTNMPMGPIELADLIGLDICSHILQSLHDQTGDLAYKVPQCVLDAVQKGNLGRKAGSGLYQSKNQS